MMLPEEDRYTQSMKEMLDQIAVSMGGRIAEEMIFQDITSGASGDINQTTRMARYMVCSFGMSRKLGFIQYGERSEHIYLGRDIIKAEGYSEETAREIDQEIKIIIDEQYARATKILSDNKDKLELLAKELLVKETIDVADIRKLLNLPEPPEKTEEGGKA